LIRSGQSLSNYLACRLFPPNPPPNAFQDRAGPGCGFGWGPPGPLSRCPRGSASAKTATESPTASCHVGRHAFPRAGAASGFRRTSANQCALQAGLLPAPVCSSDAALQPHITGSALAARGCSVSRSLGQAHHTDVPDASGLAAARPARRIAGRRIAAITAGKLERPCQALMGASRA